MRLTYLPTDNAPATHEWQTIATVEEAQALAKNARCGRGKINHKKTFSTGGNRRQTPLAEIASENRDFHRRRPPANGQNFHRRKPPVLSRSSSHLLSSDEGSEGVEAALGLLDDGLDGLDDFGGHA